MKYLYQNNILGMIKHWKLLETMVEDNYVSEENDNDYLVFGLINFLNIEEIKEIYLKNINYRKLIIYQLEPLNSNHWWKVENIIKNLHGADEIWDYDLENIEILQSQGFDPKFRPCRYTKSLDQIKIKDNPKIDVLFYGTPTEPRMKYWNHLCFNRNIEYNISWMSGIQSESLDYFLSNSKIILNLSTHSTESRQAQTRIFYPLSNNKCIISQESSINYFGDSIIQFNNESSMQEKIEIILENNLWKCSDRKINFNIFNPISKMAIFIHIVQIDNWQEQLCNLINALQTQNLYDNVDYIQISFSKNINCPYHFYKINRIRYEQKEFYNSSFDLFNFAYLNSDYKLLICSNSTEQNFNMSIHSMNNWSNTIKELDNNHLIKFSKECFWINSKIFQNFKFQDLIKFSIDNKD